jgi:serine/threonine protein kinase
MNCYRCATPIPESSRFCLSCGALVPDATLPTTVLEELDDAGARELELLLRADTAGEYEILRQIGRGAMGVVYLAREILLARDVAMKVLPPHLTYGQGAIGRFRREARTAAALEHPSIIPIYRIAPGGRLFWYTMKYLEGRSLAEVLNEQKGLPLEATITILERVGHALDYAHQRHVIHRDVKPANVMLEPQGHIVVTDFGIAKEAASGTMPGSGGILGTPFYMSPEQCKGEDLTGASDQYSVGVMAYQMLAGRVPFDSKSIIDILHKHVAESPPPLAHVSPGLPAHVYPAVERAMAKDPSERFASVIAFVRALAGPAPDATVRLPRFWSVRQRWSGVLARTPRARRRRWSWTSSLSTLVAAGLVAGALWWNGRTRTHNAAPAAPDASRPALEPPPAGTSHGSATESVATRSVIPALPKRAGTGRRALPRSTVLIIQATGGWARIYMDGAFRREGTVYRDTVTAGEHRLRLERDGYLPVDTTLSVRARDTVLVRVTMRRGRGES